MKFNSPENIPWIDIQALFVLLKDFNLKVFKSDGFHGLNLNLKNLKKSIYLKLSDMPLNPMFSHIMTRIEKP